MRTELSDEELIAFAAWAVLRSTHLRRCGQNMADRLLLGDPIHAAIGQAIAALDHLIAMVAEEQAVRARGYPSIADRAFARVANIIGPRPAKYVEPPPSSLRARATEPWTGKTVPANRRRW